MKKVLVTGSEGLIGHTLVLFLESKGVLCSCFDHKALLTQTILNPKAIEKALENCVGIVHLAGTSRVLYGESAPLECLKNNVDGTHSIIEAALKSPQRPWIIYASSREVYGQQAYLPVKEDVPLNPMNIYAYSKVLAENKILEARQKGLTTNILRFSNVFGQPFDYADRVIPAFCRAALLGSPLHVEGSANLFDFTYVKDVVRGIYFLIHMLLEKPENLPPIHLTTGRSISLGEAAYTIAKKTNSKSLVIEKPSRSFDVARFCGNPDRAFSLLGWRPEFSFEEAIGIFLRELQQYLDKEKSFPQRVAI